MSLEVAVSGATPELNKIIYRAGAGAGKTTRLVEKVLNFAKEFFRTNERWPRVVVTTFTKKATQEVRERIVLEALKTGDEGLIKFSMSKSNLQVSTIHGLLTLFLRRHANEVGVDPQFSFLSRAEEKREKVSIARKLLREDTFSPLLGDHNFYEVLNILSLFHDKLMERPDIQPASSKDLSRLANELFKLHLNVGSKIAERILAEAEKEDWLDYARAIQSMTEIADIEKFSSLSKPRFSKKNPPVSEELDSELKTWKEELKTLEKDGFLQNNMDEQSEMNELFFELGKRFSDKLNESRLKKGAYTINDLEFFSLKTLRTNKKVAMEFASSFDYWLIDEYQDTNPVQVEILSKLIGNRDHFVVGDPQQSIYLFRGARKEVFEDKEKQFGESHRDYLNTNYRSSPPLMAFFNKFFQGLGSGFSGMKPGRESAPSGRSTNEVAHFYLNDDEEVQFKSITSHITSLLNRGVKYSDICIVGRTNKELMPIAKYMSRFGLPTQVHAASGFSERREILDLSALLKFILNQKDDYALITLLRSPWFRISDETLAKVATEKADKKAGYWKTLSATEVLLDVERKAIENLKALLDQSHEFGLSVALKKLALRTGIVDFSHKHDATGRREANIWKFFVQMRLRESQAGKSFVSLLEESIEDLESAYDSESDGVSAVEPNRINLMTVHASKGLQFDHVVVPNIHKGPVLSDDRKLMVLDDHPLFAIASKNDDGETVDSVLGILQKSQNKERLLEEGDRLLYVAATRARESIAFTGKSRAIKNSWLSRLKMDLSPGKHDEKQYSYTVSSDVTEFSHAPKPKDASIDKTIPRLSQSEGIGERVSVTSLVEKMQEPSSSVKNGTDKVTSESVLSRLDVIEYGTVFHKLMELISRRSRGKGSIDLSGLEGESKEIIGAVNWMIDLQSPPMADLIVNGRPEWSFITKHNGNKLEGQIDLWGQTAGGETWVVDYKTGSTRRADKALAQLSIYADVLKKYLGVSEVKISAIFPLEREVFYSSSSSSEAPSLNSNPNPM